MNYESETDLVKQEIEILTQCSVGFCWNGAASGIKSRPLSNDGLGKYTSTVGSTVAFNTTTLITREA